MTILKAEKKLNIFTWYQAKNNVLLTVFKVASRNAASLTESGYLLLERLTIDLG